VIDRVNADINRVLKLPDIADTLAKQGLQPTGGTPAALAELTKSDLERWTAVVRAAKIQPD
jgi:tripartite-type tricarboxylate transporter receptor subunit TctC